MAYFYTLKGKTKIIFTILGTFMMAVAVRMVYEPLGMVTGGISGFGIVINKLFYNLLGINVPVFVTNIFINVPLFIFAYKKMGRNFAKHTLIAIVGFTLFLWIIPMGVFESEDLFFAAVFGGVITGIGMGIIFAMNISTGGTDLIGTLIHQKIKYRTVAQILMVIDSIVVIMGALVFGIEKAFYSVVAVYVTSKVADIIAEGGKFGRMVYIISDESYRIAESIMKNVNRGISCIRIIGMFSKKEKNMLLCVISRKEITKLSEIVAEIDINAFVIVSDVREVLGEGFIKIDNKS